MSDEIKTKNFVDIVKDFVKKMQTTIDNEDGTSGLYRYISDLLKDLNSNITEELTGFSESAKKYYNTIKVEVDAKTMQKSVKDIPAKIKDFEKEYNNWKEFCLKKIDDLFNDEDKVKYAKLKGTLEANHGNVANPDTQVNYKLYQANKDLQARVAPYFEQNEYLIMLNKHTDSPHEVLTDQMASQAQTCRKLIDDIKQSYQDFMVEYIKLSSDHIVDNDNKDAQEAFNEDNTLDLDRFYTEGLQLDEEEVEEYIDKEGGFVKIPFRSVSAKVFQEQGKVTIANVDDPENEVEQEVATIAELGFIDKLRLYFALYIEQYKESIRINKNIEIFNTLISYKNNPQSLQYKIDTIKEVYNDIDLDEGQALEAYVKYNWETIFKKSSDAGYWKEIPDEDMPAFSEYLQKAVLDISKGLLDNMAPKYTKIKFTKNAKGSFFKKRSGYYVVDLNCLEPLMNGLHLVTRTELNEKAIMESIDGADQIDNPFFIENIKGSIVNGAWNGKYPIILKMIKEIKDISFKKVMKNTFVK